MSWLVAAVIGLAAAAAQYVRPSAPAPLARGSLAALRALAVTLLVALLLDAPLGRARPAVPLVFVDASLSMGRERAPLWQAAWDSATAQRADSVLVFGDSVRAGDRDQVPGDGASRVRPVVERTMATGRPAVIVTDGEVPDSGALDGLTSGSRVVIVPRPARSDAALVAMDAPRAAVAGDSLEVRVTIAAGAQGASAGSVGLALDRQPLGRWPLNAMSPWSERQLDVRVRLSAGQGGAPALLRAIVSSPGDAEPRNDTLAVAIEISRAASAVFVSTSPDQDARFAIAVLRGTLALPTRGFLRVAPARWVHEGSLAAATEAEVRAAMRDAPVVILHGDTTIFGPPRSASIGPLALLVPSGEEGEWYPSATPPSPLSGALSAIPLDSLPPITAGAAASGDWVALEARRGREATRRPVVSGRDGPRRTVTVTGSGFWRWRFRGGASADAYAALWGGIFDWLAAERADRRGAVPDLAAVREGEPIRWRRGSAADTAVRVILQRRGATRTDTLLLRFAVGGALEETPALPRGAYDVSVPGGRTLLVVNPAAELLPTRPRLSAGSVGRRARPDDAPRARTAGALYVMVVLLLCAEWMLRRRVGLR